MNRIRNVLNVPAGTVISSKASTVWTFLSSSVRFRSWYLIRVSLDHDFPTKKGPVIQGLGGIKSLKQLPVADGRKSVSLRVDVGVVARFSYLEAHHPFSVPVDF